MESNYNPQSVEDAIFARWEESGAFTPSTDPARRPFTIIMPPPNANDPLHIGHAMFIAIEDILIRYHRMKGDAALWLPGTDHAGIETQFVFEKKLAKEGKSRFDYDRKTLYTMIWDYVQENSGVAVSQMKKLGASADWSRFKFTLNPEIVSFVLQTFRDLYQDGLIYRKERLVNYCTKCGTSYSDLEVEHKDQQGLLYLIKYESVQHPGTFVTVATTRPETMLGDVAVAVNPDDPRYRAFWKQHETVRLPLVNREIPVIADPMADMEFGTGAVKITPSHDRNDEAVAERMEWDLTNIYEKHTVIGFNGKMNANAGAYAGLGVDEARKRIVADLGDLVSTKPYTNSVGACYRCGRAIEPLPRTQFFIRVNDNARYDMTGTVLTAMKRGAFRVYGSGRAAILTHWLTNLKDWNISRQIVWGIRIPVWYRVDGQEDRITVGFIDRKKAFHQGSVAELMAQGYSLSDIADGIQQMSVPADFPESATRVSIQMPTEKGTWFQETDTLDTWFSSGQWPVATLKTNQPGDFDYFYPTSVMETGYDILPIWVLRMLLLGMYLTRNQTDDAKRVPFTDIYLHGLVRDEKGQKMSKSKGNVINPLSMVERYGADAVRMALVMSSTPGQDKAVGENTIRGMRNLTNKLWNAARYLYSQNPKTGGQAGALDEELMEKTRGTAAEITADLDTLRIGQAAERAYAFFWHEFCDRYIEEHKKGTISLATLNASFETILALLHPFLPFITEELWRISPIKHATLLMSSPWPKTA